MRRSLVTWLGWAMVAVRAVALEPLTFYPDWFPGAQFAGVYVAIDRGYYREEGLDVSVVPFAFGQKTAELVAAEPETCGVMSFEGYIFLQRRAQGQDLKVAGAMLQQGPAGFMSLRKTGIASAGDFAGQRIGVHKFADPLYRWFVRRAGLQEADAKMVFVDDDIERLVRGEIDAMQGFATAEFVRLRALVGDQAQFLPFAALGFDSYSQLVVTTTPQLARHRDKLRRFIVATRQGWEQAFAQPDAAVASIRARVGPGTSDPFERAALDALKDYVAPGGSHPLPAMDRAKWERLQATCVEIGFLKAAEPVENFLVELEGSTPEAPTPAPKPAPKK